MSQLLINISWLAITVSAVAGFLLGALWYSPVLFLKGWANGSNINLDDTPKNWVSVMLTQFIGTFLLAWLINLASNNGVQVYACLAILATATLILTGGGYNQKSLYAKMVEFGYIIVMSALMMLVQGFF